MRTHLITYLFTPIFLHNTQSVMLCLVMHINAKVASHLMRYMDTTKGALKDHAVNSKDREDKQSTQRDKREWLAE